MLRDSAGDVLAPAPDAFIPHGLDVEMNWHGGDPIDRVTPTDRFFVRNHSVAPRIDADSWRLRVHGDGVSTERSWTLDDLRALGSITVERALECTGNGRRYFAEQQDAWKPGTQWGLGAIGLARWTGVPLRTVLEESGIRPDAVQVMAAGLDDPYVADGVDHGRVRRPLPMDKALADDVLVAWEMNGAPLPADHGFPVRLVVPGWVGIASIKWLGDLDVQTAKVDSPWTTIWYRLHGPGFDDAADPTAAELGAMPVKSMLDLAPGTTFEAGTPVTLTGRAWAGEAAIESVEFSVDGGAWQPAQLTGANDVSSMTCFTIDWTPTEPGEHELRTRARDTSGRIQPDSAVENDDGYLFWAIVRCPVRVV